MIIYLQENGANAGPFDESAVREPLNHGTISADAGETVHRSIDTRGNVCTNIEPKAN